MADPKIKYDIEAAVTGEADAAKLAEALRNVGDVLEGDLQKSALDAAQALEALGAKQRALESFGALKKETQQLSTALESATSVVDRLGTRADIARRIEAGMSPGPEWAGYLLENHYQTMRSVTLLQRPGMSPPTIGRTYLLVYNEALAGERRQRIRIKTVDTQVRTFTEIVNNQLIDFQAQVTTCELFDGLLFDYPGSPPTRSYARQAAKTVVRETVYSDSGMFCGASRLTAATQINDVWLQVASIYTQLVPNSRTEASTVDQRPSARQTLVLATAPRKVEVGVTPHTQRIKIAEENAGLTFVAQLQPLPEPGMVFVDYWSLGTRYTIYDDGTGRLTGAGGGVVSHLTGAMSFTLKALPDIGSSISITHGSRVAYTDRSSQGAAVRPPEYCWLLEEEGVVPGSIVVTWYSAGVLRTATDNGQGTFTGDGAGVIDYPSGTVLLRPAHLPDPGGELNIAYTTDLVHTETFAAPAPDAGGFVTLTLAQQPAAGTLAIAWATARAVANTSGGSQSTTTAVKNSNVTYTVRSVPEFYTPGSSGSSSGSSGGSGVIPGSSGSFYAPNWPRSDT